MIDLGWRKMYAEQAYNFVRVCLWEKLLWQRKQFKERWLQVH